VRCILNLYRDEKNIPFDYVGSFIGSQIGLISLLLPFSTSKQSVKRVATVQNSLNEWTRMNSAIIEENPHS
jgi:hypothetical protein